MGEGPESGLMRLRETGAVGVWGPDPASHGFPGDRQKAHTARGTSRGSCSDQRLLVNAPSVTQHPRGSAGCWQLPRETLSQRQVWVSLEKTKPESTDFLQRFLVMLTQINRDVRAGLREPQPSVLQALPEPGSCPHHQMLPNRERASLSGGAGSTGRRLDLGRFLRLELLSFLSAS